MNRRGFTLVEILIVMLIIGMLAMIAIPGWMKIRQTSQETACKENRRVIEDAKQHWALDKQHGTGDVPTAADLSPEFMTKEPVCPQHGTYSYNAIGTPPSCSLHGNAN